MSWLGKMLGGSLGFVFGGPLGAILGATLGHHALDSGRSMSLEENRQTLFFLATFSMLGKLSKADGQVSAEEIRVVEQLMDRNLKLSSDARRFAINIFNEAKNSQDQFRDYALQFYEEFRDSKEALFQLIDLLLTLANADGVMHPEEERLIEEAVAIFHLEREYSQLKAPYFRGDELEKSLKILGASANESFPEIKKKYRRLAMKHHPDKVQAQGVSPELIAVSEARFKEIQHAYDIVEKRMT